MSSKYHLLLSIAYICCPHASFADQTQIGPIVAVVQAVAVDQSSIDVLPETPASAPLHLVATDSVVTNTLKLHHSGDHVRIFYFLDPSKKILTSLQAERLPTASSYIRVWSLIAAAGVCLLLGCVMSGFRPWRLMIGQDNRYSNSIFQIAVWFFVLISSYLATLFLRVSATHWDFIGGINIPPHLLVISGVSAFTYAGAKAITTSKDQGATASGVDDPKNAADATPHFLLDLTHDDGKKATLGQPAIPRQLDFGGCQMFVITIIAVATYLILSFNSLGSLDYSTITSLPDVDTTILSTFGLGRGAYWQKKPRRNWHLLRYLRVVARESVSPYLAPFTVSS